MFMGPRNWVQGMNSASLCSLAGRYDKPIPPRFLAPIDILKIPALFLVWRIFLRKLHFLLAQTQDLLMLIGLKRWNATYSLQSFSRWPYNSRGFWHFRARIFKRLWSPRIDSKIWIPPAHVARWAGTITLAPIDCLKIPALTRKGFILKARWRLITGTEYGPELLTPLSFLVARYLLWDIHLTIVVK